MIDDRIKQGVRDLSADAFPLSDWERSVLEEIESIGRYIWVVTALASLSAVVLIVVVTILIYGAS